MSTTRKIQESPLVQGVDERIAYQLTTTPWGSDPSSPVFVLKDSAGTDVTATYSTGSVSASGDVITTPTVHSLDSNGQYRMEIKFVIDGNTFEAYANLYGET